VAGPQLLRLWARRDAAGAMARRRCLPSARFPPVAVPRQPALPRGAPGHDRRSRMGGSERADHPHVHDTELVSGAPAVALWPARPLVRTIGGGRLRPEVRPRRITVDGVDD